MSSDERQVPREVGISVSGLAGVAFATGAAVMVVELMAVRLMAPWFGQSQIVWTNVIGVVLLALAAGQWVGGRWAEGWAAKKDGASPGWASPAVLLTGAGAFAIALPSIVPAMAAAVLPDDLRLTEAFPFVSLGSLLVALVGIGVPLFALGAVTPWLVRLSRGVTTEPGRVTGRLLGAGTLGSLLGTFGATHILLTLMGAAGAIRAAGLVLVVIGVLLARTLGKRLRGAWVLVAAALATAALADAAPRTSGGRILEIVETPYQFAYVDEDEHGTRALRINEALDSFHSLYREGELLTGMYYDAFLAPTLASPPTPSGTQRVMIVGLGGGTMARQLLELDPDLQVAGIEIDAELVRLGRQYMALPDDVDVAAGVDGRFGLAASEGPFSAVLIDAYAQQIYLPHHLCTAEFFALVRSKLVDGGLAALNLGGLTRSDPVVRAVAGTFASEFDHVTMARIPNSRNLICLGWRGSDASRGRWGDVLAEHGLDQDVGWLTDATLFGDVPSLADVEILTDGYAPVEALAHASWKSGG